MIQKFYSFEVNRHIEAKQFFKKDWDTVWRRNGMGLKRLHDERFFINDSFINDGDFIVKFSDDSSYIRLSKKDFLALTSHE